MKANTLTSKRWPRTPFSSLIRSTARAGWVRRPQSLSAPGYLESGWRIRTSGTRRVLSFRVHEQIVPTWTSERFGSQKFRDVLDDYRLTTKIGSGADLVSQIAGGIAVWDGRIDEMRRFSWPFPDLALTIILTGKKMPSHSHLSGLEPLQADVRTEMGSWVEEAVQAFALEDADRLTASVRGVGKVLEENGRLAEHSKALLDQLGHFSGVRAAKGCGAMGSDVIAVLHDRSAKLEIDEFCKTNGLKQAAGDGEIAKSGLELHARSDSMGVGVTT